MSERLDRISKGASRREPLVGLWCVTADPLIIRVLGSASPDYIAVDAQHGLLHDSDGVVSPSLIRSMDALALVRMASHSAARLGRAADLGYDGVIVPMVDSGDQAKAIVAALRYPPEGRRSAGPIDPIAGEPDRSPLAIGQIETAAGLDAVEDIATSGLDGLYVGPADLSLALTGRRLVDIRHIWENPAGGESALGRAVATVASACEAHGLIAGIHCPDGATAALALANGFTMATVGSELSALRRDLAVNMPSATDGLGGGPA